MKRLIIPMVLSFCCLFAAEETKITTKEVYNVFGGKGCLQYLSYEAETGGSGMLHFKSNCDVDVNAVVCVTYADGTKEILKNSARIQRGSHWSVATFGESTPASIDWSVAPNDPKTPAGCSK